MKRLHDKVLKEKQYKEKLDLTKCQICKSNVSNPKYQKKFGQICDECYNQYYKP